MRVKGHKTSHLGGTMKFEGSAAPLRRSGTNTLQASVLYCTVQYRTVPHWNQ